MISVCLSIIIWLRSVKVITSLLLVVNIVRIEAYACQKSSRLEPVSEHIDIENEDLNSNEADETTISIVEDKIVPVIENSESDELNIDLVDIDTIKLAKEMLEKKQYLFNDCSNKKNLESADLKVLHKIQIEIYALSSYISANDIKTNSITQTLQPELPILKNNDQSKEWVENYKAWGEWYYASNIDCHYYKFDFANGDRIIVE